MEKPEEKKKEAEHIGQIMEHMGFGRYLPIEPKPVELTPEQEKEKAELDNILKHMSL